MTSTAKSDPASTYMRHALELAQRALGTTSPNPAVGAVIVRDGQVVGEGFTQPAGQSHAEIVALAQAGRQARGATIYVTLEPCGHSGRTPPCVQAILKAGVKEVHFSGIDPNPLVMGKGQIELEQGGVKTVSGEEEKANRRLNEAYFKFMETRSPFVTAKFAASLDGRIATRTLDSRWITSERARLKAHALRAISDAVLVGVGTVLADDPLLTVRDRRDEPMSQQPLRVIVDSKGRTPTKARLLGAPGPILIAGATIPGERINALENSGAELVLLPGQDGLVGLKALLTHLGQREMTSVLVEGGGTLLGSFFDLGLVDKVTAFIAPIIIGGKEAVPAIGGRGSGSLAEALLLRDVETERLGDDILVTGYPSRDD